MNGNPTLTPSYLGAADTYLYLFKHQDVYQYANWFQVNAYDPLDVWEWDADKILVPRQTGWGASYNVMRAVYQDAELLNSTTESVALKPGSAAVVAQAVLKAGKRLVLAVNKTPQVVPFALNFDGAAYRGHFKHEALAFDSLDQNKTWAFEENPLQLVKQGAGALLLPPYSINVIFDFAGVGQ